MLPEILREPRFPGQVPSQLTAPEILEGDTLYLEGEELRIIALGHIGSQKMRPTSDVPTHPKRSGTPEGIAEDSLLDGARASLNSSLPGHIGILRVKFSIVFGYNILRGAKLALFAQFTSCTELHVRAAVERLAPLTQQLKDRDGGVVAVKKSVADEAQESATARLLTSVDLSVLPGINVTAKFVASLYSKNAWRSSPALPITIERTSNMTCRARWHWDTAFEYQVPRRSIEPEDHIQGRFPPYLEDRKRLCRGRTLSANFRLGESDF